MADADNKYFVFKEETRKECLVLPITRLSDFCPIYPETLKALDLENLAVGIWVSGSREIIEYVSPFLTAVKKQHRIAQLLRIIPAYQAVSKLLVKKQEQQNYYQNISTARKAKAQGLELSAAEQDLSESYLKLTDCSAKIMAFVDQNAVNAAEQVAIEVVTKVGQMGSCSELLLKMLNHNSELYDHISFSTLMAVSIGSKLGLSATQLKLLSLGCLFMDIGLTRLNIPNLYTHKLSPTDQLLFERHPMIGVDELNELEAAGVSLPEEIFTITEQHHEAFNGRGFPNGLKGRLSKENRGGIHLFASIVGLAEKFAGYFKEQENKPRFKPLQAIKSINRLSNAFDPSILLTFNQIVGYSPEESVQLDEKVTWITKT